MVDLLDKVAYLLQTGSAWTAGTLFDLPGVPVLREGFVFHLAGVNIEVAKQCSSHPFGFLSADQKLITKQSQRPATANLRWLSMEQL